MQHRRRQPVEEENRNNRKINNQHETYFDSILKTSASAKLRIKHPLTDIGKACISVQVAQYYN